MKRVFAIGLAAIVAAAQAWAIEPEPIETHQIPDTGIVYPPPDPDNPNPPPVTVIIDKDGGLIPVDGELPYGDNAFETALEAMITALKTAAAISDLKKDMESYKAVVNAGLREQTSLIEENKCKCGEGGGGSISVSETEYQTAEVEFNAESALLTIYPFYFGLEKKDDTIGIKSRGAEAYGVQFAKIAGSGSLKDARDYQTCYNQAKGDWMATILSYHDGQATPTAISNFNPVAFSGNYTDLTNTPSIKVEPIEEEGGGGGYKITLVTGGGEEGDGSMPLEKIAGSGSWNDLKDIPERATNCYTRAETDARIDERISAHHASCNHAGEGGGGGGQGGGCSCQISTAADVRAVEEDPEATPRINALETRVAKLEDDMREASTRIAVLEEAVGKKATIGIMPEPGTMD